MRLVITPEIAAAYPDLRIGILVGTGAANDGGADAAALETLKTEAAQHARAQGYTTETLSEHPFMSAWRETYRSFGTKPGKYRPTAEALVRRVLQGDGIPSISPLVDAYLAVEARWWLPVGGYDLDLVKGDVVLRFSGGGEAFRGIGADEDEYTDQGEVIYCDDERVLTRRWNYKDADATKVTPQSVNVVLCVEAPAAAIPSEAVEGCVEAMAEGLKAVCHGSWRTMICDATAPAVPLTE
ncbi:MAG: phenylalanine--tRNA ligase beta subunit-related protein [Armatimonadia bacterium]